MTADLYPSVTAFLSAYPKQDALVPWAARTTAEAAVRETAWTELADDDAKIAYLKGAPRRINKVALDHGTWVHNLFEAIAKGKPEGVVDSIEAEILRDAIARYDMEIIASEFAVLNHTHRYGGSGDLLARIRGLVYLIDLKSSLDVYPDYRLQQSAYRYGEWLAPKDAALKTVIRGGKEIHLYRSDAPVIGPMLPVDRVAILHVARETPEDWGLFEIKADREDFETFLHVKATWEWKKNAEKQPQPAEVPAAQEEAA